MHFHGSRQRHHQEVRKLFHYNEKHFFALLCHFALTRFKHCKKYQQKQSAEKNVRRFSTSRNICCLIPLLVSTRNASSWLKFFIKEERRKWEDNFSFTPIFTHAISKGVLRWILLSVGRKKIWRREKMLKLLVRSFATQHRYLLYAVELSASEKWKAREENFHNHKSNSHFAVS